MRIGLSWRRILLLAVPSSSSRRSAAHRKARAMSPDPECPAPEDHCKNNVVELVRFAVAEHNRKANTMLELKRLVTMRQQVVAGIMHYFTVEVQEPGGGKKLYEAKVWEKGWENFKQLQSFEPVGDAAAA